MSIIDMLFDIDMVSHILDIIGTKHWNLNSSKGDTTTSITQRDELSMWRDEVDKIE